MSALQRRKNPPPPPEEPKKLQRRTLTRANAPRLVHQELQSASPDSRMALAPVLGQIFATADHPLIVEVERLASMGIPEPGIAAAWDLSIKELDVLKKEYPELDQAILRGHAKHYAEQESERNNPFAVQIAPEDLENLDTDKLKDGMYKGIYALEAALFGQAGFSFQRVQKLRKTLTQLETDILDPKELATFTKQERLAFYEQMNRTMSNEMRFLTKLHDSVTSGLEAVTSVEKHRTTKNLEPTTITSESDKDRITEAKSMIMEALKNKVTQK